QAVALINDQKPEAAVDLLSDALARIGNTPGANTVDPDLRAALELNLSAAYLQLGDPHTASAHSAAAVEQFKASNDVVGQAQALHLSGINAINSGNSTAGQQFLRDAASLLQSVSIAPSPVGGAPAPVPAPVRTISPIRTIGVGSELGSGTVAAAIDVK